MLSYVPVMVIITMTLSMVFLSTKDLEDTSKLAAVSNDFRHVHSFRVSYAHQNNIVDGPISVNVGYPFNSFYTYYTEAVEVGESNLIVSWPVSSDTDLISDEEEGRVFLSILETNQGAGLYSIQGPKFYAGNYVPNENPATGGRIGPIAISGMDVTPPEDVPILVKVSIDEP
jgi:hypothetical protein